MHHVFDAKATCFELWRVLKPGGRIVIQEPDIRTVLVKIVALVEKAALMRSHFISSDKLAAYFSKCQAQIKIERDGYTSWLLVDKII